MNRIVRVMTEGELTEPSYLSMDSMLAAMRRAGVGLKLLTHHKGQTDPASLVRAMRTAMRREMVQKGDEAWLVMDVDEWTEAQFDAALSWSKTAKAHHLAVGNPKFELFLLMHFGEAKGCASAKEVDARLKACWKEYRKRIPAGAFTIEQVAVAVERAAQADSRPDSVMPAPGETKFYKLLESLLDIKPSR